MFHMSYSIFYLLKMYILINNIYSIFIIIFFTHKHSPLYKHLDLYALYDNSIQMYYKYKCFWFENISRMIVNTVIYIITLVYSYTFRKCN